MRFRAKKSDARWNSRISDIDDRVVADVQRLNSGGEFDRRKLLANLNRLQGRRIIEMEPNIFKDLDEILR